ncbi:MAG: four helix bundle protein [Proteobacteria bacterium]|nr:four helix bundle protein [Pseudomonadota bacterium]
MARKHYDLVVWQQAILLVKAVYALSARFPQSEVYGLTSQIRRAAVSIPANIAEGVGRSGAKDRVQFFVIARGSLSELDTLIVLAKELGFASDTAEISGIVDRVFALIGGLINAERGKSAST